VIASNHSRGGRFRAFQLAIAVPIIVLAPVLAGSSDNNRHADQPGNVAQAAGELQAASDAFAGWADPFFGFVLPRPNTGDEGPQLKIPIPCEQNLPPHAVATSDPIDLGNVTVGDTVQFDSSGSHDDDGQIAEREWIVTTAGDAVVHSAQSPELEFQFTAAGDYVVSLQVADNCGDYDTEELNVTVVPGDPGGFAAAFKVYEQTGVNASGNPIWEEIDLATQDIEAGQRVKFDASPSQGAASLFWDFGDSSGGCELTCIHPFAEPGAYTVSLMIYSADWMQYDMITRTVFVTGFEHASTMGESGTTFHPALQAAIGSQLWSITTYGVLGVATISDPHAMPSFTIFPSYDFSNVVDMAVSDVGSQRYLYLATGTTGVEVYRASPTAFTRLNNLCLSAAQLGVAQARFVQSIGGYLYVGTTNPDMVLTYSMAAPSPVLIHSLPLTGLEGMSLIPSNGLVVYGASGQVKIVDLRNPAAPTVAHTINTGQQLFWDSAACASSVAIRSFGATLVFEIAIPPSGPITYGSQHLVPFTTNRFAVDHNRLILRDTYTVRQYDWTDPAQPYLMYELGTSAVGGFPILLHDLDSSGEPTLLVGVNQYGYSSFCKAAVR
jgi:PKD repeat protein